MHKQQTDTQPGDTTLNEVPCGYLEFNDEGTLINVNETACALLNYDREELLHSRLEALFTIAGKIFFQTHLFPLIKLQGGAEEIFLNLQTKNKTTLAVVSRSLRYERKTGAVNACAFIPVESRRKYEDEILQAKRQSEEALKANLELIAAKEDATRKTRELEKQLSKLDQLNSELMQFNRIINHDMQECIRKILMFTRLSYTDDTEDYRGKIIYTAERLKNINAALNNFIGPELEETTYTTVQLPEIIRQSAEKAQRDLSFEALQLTLSTLPEIEASEEQMNILLYQLIHNAIKFRNGDAVAIDVSAVIIQENIFNFLRDTYEYRDMLRMTITDNGKGFDSAYKAYVFSIFKKLGTDNSGYGIGLSLCKKVVNNHHGKIEIDSVVDKGTTVKITLPLKQF